MRGLSSSVLTLLLCGTPLHANSFERVSLQTKPDNPEGQYELAKKYETGVGAERNLETAIQLYEQAARHGHAQSMLRLGIIYYNGDVLGDEVKPDLQRAWLWFTFAAAHGETQATLDAERIVEELHPANFRIVRMNAAKTLVEGNEVPPNVAKGLELYRSAAQDGSVKAAEILGTLYMEGTHVPRDLEQASAWYEKAAGAGSLRAVVALAKVAESGSPPNLVRASELYRKAALQADTRSMYRLGEMYGDGSGVQRDLVSAHAWFAVAGYFELAEGKAAARELETKMTRAQIDRAQIVAHNFIVSVEPFDPSSIE